MHATLLGLVLAAAAAAPTATPTPLVFPPPPDSARYAWEASIDEAEDLGIRPGRMRALWNWIWGIEPAGRISRPVALALDERRLCVVDGALRCVHVFDRERKTYRRIAPRERPFRSPVGAALCGDSVVVTDSEQAEVREFALETGDVVGSVAATRPWLRPTGIAFDRSSGRLYVTDTLHHCVVSLEKRSGEWVERERLGSRGERTGTFNFPTHLAVAPSGEVVVSDTMNFRVQRLDRSGRARRSIGALGDRVGELSKPKGVAVDDGGRTYVVESIHDVILIYGAEGEFLMPLGRSGAGPGEFSLPSGLAWGAGRLYVADTYNGRIQVFGFLQAAAEEVVRR